MSLSKEQEAAALKAYNAYWESYLQGDVHRIIELLDDKYTQVGSAETEVFYNKKEAIQFLHNTIDQVAGNLEMRNRITRQEYLTPYIIFHELCDVYAKTNDAWIFYAKFRATTIMEHIYGDWKIIHQHSSFPDPRTGEGDNVAIDKIAAENEQLREAIKRRTVELEYKNKELQVEASLERVRVHAMSMHKPDNLPDICQSIYDELLQLGFDELRNAMINIYNEEEAQFLNYDYAPAPGKTVTLMPFNFHPLVEKQVSITRLSKDAFFEFSFAGEELTAFRELRKQNGEQDDPKLDNSDSLHYYFFAIETGSIGISTYSQITPEKLALLKRFRNVFDFAYRRYIEVSQAEAQAYESKVQASLERVRAQAMGIHTPDDLSAVGEIIFAELKSLGFSHIRNTEIIVNQDQQQKLISYYYSDYGVTGVIEVDPATHPTVQQWMDDLKQNSDSFASVHIAANEMAEWRAYRESLGYLPDPKLDQANTIEYYSYSVGPGAISVSTFHPLTPEQHKTLERFKNVFGLAYRRYADVAQAEQQAQEARIQLSLERVRARTMAMQQSFELGDAASLLYHELKTFGISSLTSGFCILDGNEEIGWNYISNQTDGTVIGKPMGINHKATEVMRNITRSWKRQDPFHIVQLNEDETIVHQTFIAEETINFNLTAEALIALTPKRLNLQTFNFKQGYLLLVGAELLTTAQIDMLIRFAKVFELTYTRFLDLQKAETQAREAQIEAALERVRSRSLAMQKSAELQDMVRVMFEQLLGLNIDMNVASIFIFQEGRKDWEQWVASADTNYSTRFNIPYYDHVIFRDLEEAREQGLDFYHKIYSKQEKNTWLQFAVVNTEYSRIPKERQEYMLESDCFNVAFALGSHSGLQLAKYTAVEFTEGEMSIAQRFARVFEQAYVRFLDLQKAEAQAREATKQASLDRVRGQIASMRSTADLERITPLIWQELTHLDIPFIRCGVFIMQEDKEIVEAHLASPEGSSLGVLNLHYASSKTTIETVAHWRNNEVYKQHWTKEAFLEWTRSLLDQGQITDAQSYQGAYHTPESLYLHFVPFTQGMLYVGNSNPLTDEELQLVQSLAEAFAIAYARYEDFKTLEKAKQSIETALSELKATQSQLIQSEKMASLGELTAGIAHEIQNPLNFVNNFSEVSKELLEEMKEAIAKGETEEVMAITEDIIQNLGKILHHGKRADAIVKGMLQHSRSSSGTKESTDINILADEYLRLAYHGLRAKDKSFNATLKTDFDENIGPILVIPQDIGRVILNLITNAFYACTERSKNSIANAGALPYEPTVEVSTRKIRDMVEIKVKDNGNGIPNKVLDKIFQPFFTTKPTGQGTGLGLSLSYDILKAHGGELKVSTTEGLGSEFVIVLPVNTHT